MYIPCSPNRSTNRKEAPAPLTADNTEHTSSEHTRSLNSPAQSSLREIEDEQQVSNLGAAMVHQTMLHGVAEQHATTTPETSQAAGPPPPPPPLSVGQHNATPYMISSNDPIDRLSALQEDLRDAREDLIGARFRLRTKRLALLKTQEKLVSRVRNVFDSTRQYLLTKDLDVPDHIEAAWLEIEAIRDPLGEQELDYDQTEKDYNLEEWRYTGKEKRFLETIASHILVPKAPKWEPPPSNDLAELMQHPLHTPQSDFTPALLDDVTIPPTAYQAPNFDHFSLKKHDNDHDDSTVEPLANRANATNDYGRMEEVKSQARVPMDFPADSTPIRTHINKWMFGILLSSSLERKRFESGVPRGDRGEKEWLDLVTRHWFSHGSDEFVCQTGDTTVSDATIDGAVSANIQQDDLSRPYASESHSRISCKSIIVPDGRVSGTMASFENPMRIKSRDLSDGPRHVTFQTSSTSSGVRTILPMSQRAADSQHVRKMKEISAPSGSMTNTPTHREEDCPSSTCSDSTQLTATTRLSKESVHDNSSNSTIELENFHHDQCQGNENAIEKAFGRPESEPMHPGGVASRHKSTITSTDLSAQAQASSKVQAFDAPVTHIPELSHVSDFPQPSPDSFYDNSKTSLMNTEIESLEYSDGLGSLPQTVNFAKSQTRHPFAPFIRVNSSDPWTLPLLRLTPLPSPFNVDSFAAGHGGRLENVPFVSISNTPFRLPGPSFLLDTHSVFE